MRTRGGFGSGGFGSGGGAGGGSGSVDSVFGRTGAITAAEADYTITQLGDVTITSVATDQVLAYNGSAWVNTSVGIATNAQTGTTYTVLTGDRGKLVTQSNTSATTVTLPQSGGAGFAAGWYYKTCNINTGPVTIVPTTSTINGVARLFLFNGWCATIVGDGTNYRADVTGDAIFVANCTTSGSCATQAATTPGVANGSIDTASGTSGTSTLYFGPAFTLPANYLTANKAIRVCYVLEYTTSASPPTIELSLNFGTTPVVSTLTTAAPGASLTTRGVGMCYIVQGTAAIDGTDPVEAGLDTFSPIGATGNTIPNDVAQPVTIDASATQVISLSALWSANTAANSLTVRQVRITALN